MERFEYAIDRKRPLLDSLWARTSSINVSDYSFTKWGSPKVTYLYSKEGKWLSEFYSREECAKYIGVQKAAISKAIQNESLVQNMYYVSDSLVDIFVPKPRRSLSTETFYVYKENGEFIGKFIGKELRNAIDEHSWTKIRDIFRYKHNWYKEFYISFELLSENLPKRPTKGIKVDIFDKYGNFIETLDTVKEVKEKYKIPSSKIRDIQKGDKYFGDYIFKYSK